MKEELLESLDDARAREAELEVLVEDTPAHPDGRWNAKDHLAHLTWWRLRCAETLDDVRAGRELPTRLEDDDEQNAIIYAESRDRSAADVKAAARDAWASLREAIAASSEDELARPHPRQPGTQIWEIVPGLYGHVGTHVWSWFLDIGGVDRALAMARWASEVEGRFFDKPEQLAVSRYNLACVFARLGKAEEAIPLLSYSFEARPDLVAVARKDSDLDLIREDRELVRLLAT